jgi:redox-sensitive bicupin YhaK (pirin superfamily)
VTLHADASLYAGLFDGDQLAELEIDPSRRAYVHLIRGALDINGHRLQAGDAALLAHEGRITLEHGEGAEVLVFELSA